MNQHRQPLVAIVDNNMFAALGLKGILQSVMPIMQVETFLSFEELSHADPERFYHYFVAVNIVLNHRSFFIYVSTNRSSLWPNHFCRLHMVHTPTGATCHRRALRHMQTICSPTAR